MSPDEPGAGSQCACKGRVRSRALDESVLGRYPCYHHISHIWGKVSTRGTRLLVLGGNWGVPRLVISFE
jgi:hypothetical protein